MSANSKIEWCTHTHNLWWGCDEIGGDPACDECYARDLAENPFWWGKQTMFPVWGKEVGRRFFAEEHYGQPLAWNRKAAKEGVPSTVLCMSMGDWAEGRADQRPYLDKYLFPLVENTPWLIWLLLTKRPNIAQKIVPERWQSEGWPKNAWPGVTAVTQKWWDLRVPALMKIPASRHFVSAEPLMERIDMSRSPLPSWVIAGGESGAKARPMHPDWARSVRDQCLAVGVKYFFKQWGEWAPLGRVFDYYRDGRAVRDNATFVRAQRKYAKEHGAAALLSPGQLAEGRISDCVGYGEFALGRVGKARAGRLLDGVEWNEFPEAMDV